ncbi:hypothetical protein J3Q64DRAFT_1731933 [Phycomyces blakesleeanus]|uniref:Uncharacterized protein n=1 Tax=Phycomyces blakesleeanus TaxID=4837 RepID=A0ABR3B3V3_PHYBL
MSEKRKHTYTTCYFPSSPFSCEFIISNLTHIGIHLFFQYVYYTRVFTLQHLESLVLLRNLVSNALLIIILFSLPPPFLFFYFI